MVVKEESTEKRKDLACLSLKVGDTWDKALQGAKLEGRSISSYIRELIKKDFRNKRKKELASVDA